MLLWYTQLAYTIKDDEEVAADEGKVTCGTATIICIHYYTNFIDVEFLPHRIL